MYEKFEQAKHVNQKDIIGYRVTVRDPAGIVTDQFKCFTPAHCWRVSLLARKEYPGCTVEGETLLKPKCLGSVSNYFAEHEDA